MLPTSAKTITGHLLREWPLPTPADGDKEARGRILVVAGMRSIPGAAILAATAALRAGAGKLQIAAPASVAVPIAVEVPEALVLPFEETNGGAPSLKSVDLVHSYAKDADAIVVGPGMAPNEECTAFTCALIEKLEGPLVLDASALFACRRNPEILEGLHGRAILTPHTNELARLLNVSPSEITEKPLEIATEAAQRLNAVVTLKGATTFIVSPSGEAYVNEDGHVGLATSGSGDVLAGVIGGLLARGATALQAAVWGVALHARAGAILGNDVGMGFLARELLPQLPRIMKSY